MIVQSTPKTRQEIMALVGKIETIGTLPEVVARITSTINNPKSSSDDLHKIISHDPALVARILKLCNSSMYARPTKIDSVNRAIVLLGFQAVHNLAVSASIGKLFGHATLGDDFVARDLWMHSVAVAALSREIAKKVDPSITEQAFLAGLVHDVGLLAELELCPQQLHEICRKAKPGPTTFVAIEQETIGCNHADLGSALAEKWKFPDYCCAVATYHHNPGSAPDEHELIASVVHVADVLCCQDGIGFNLTALHQILDTVELENQISVEIIESITQALPDLIGNTLLVLAA